MSVLSLPLRGSLSLPRPVRSPGYQVEGVSALVPGTGVWFKAQQLGTCWCCEDLPDSSQASTPPAQAPGQVYQYVPGGLVPVYEVGPTFATAAEILAIVFDHWHLLTGGHQPGGQGAAWLRETVENLFDPAHNWPFRPDIPHTGFSSAWLREQLAENAFDPAQLGLLSFLADLVADAFGPTGLNLPPVAG